MNEMNKVQDRACKKVARLMSVRRDRILDPYEETSLRDHLMICLNCRTFDRQLDLLSEFARRYAAGEFYAKPENIGGDRR